MGTRPQRIVRKGRLSLLQNQLADRDVDPMQPKGEKSMLRWAAIFLVIAIIAALLGFTGIAGAAADIARFLFFLFIAIFVIIFLLAIFIGRKVF